MQLSSVTPPAGGPPSVPPGLWGVLRIIATRLPPHQLLKLAKLLCFFVLLALGLVVWQLHYLTGVVPPLAPTQAAAVGSIAGHRPAIY